MAQDAGNEAMQYTKWLGEALRGAGRAPHPGKHTRGAGVAGVDGKELGRGGRSSGARGV